MIGGSTITVEMTPPSHVVLQVPEISCAHCKRAIEDALGRVPTVVEAEVDVPARHVRLVLDGASALQDAIAAIEDEGYTVPRPARVEG